MEIKKKINFFTPTFNRTGSEVALFNLINHDIRFDKTVISKVKGSLCNHLDASVKLISTELNSKLLHNSNSSITKILEGALRYFYPEEKVLAAIHKKNPADVWYINTITLPGVLCFAKKNGIPVILHTHELEHMFLSLSASEVQDIAGYPDLVIASSNTAANIIRLSGRKKMLEISYPGINFNEIQTQQRNPRYKDEFVWLMAGTMDPNKNPSIFVDIANLLLMQNSHASFVWVTNRNDNNGYIQFCKNKVIELGISDKIRWLYAKGSEYYELLSAADGFILTSSRESLSLVAIEALYCQKPVVSFDNGGINEIVEANTGVVVKHDIHLFVNAMLKIMTGEFKFNAERALATASKFSVTSQKQVWDKIMNNYFDLKTKGDIK